VRDLRDRFRELRLGFETVEERKRQLEAALAVSQRIETERLQRLDEAIAAFKKALKRDPKYVQAMANMGGILYMRGELEDSIRYSRKALELAPDFGPAWNNLALAHLELGEHAQAAEYLAKAIALGFEPPAKVLEELKPYMAAKG